MELATEAGVPVVISLDEAGYTGDDLLNGDQPVFVLASTSLTDDDAGELLKAHFPDTQARELKHSAVSARPKGQRRVVEFVRAASKSDTFAIEIWHKEYTLVTTMVDAWVEESTRLYGIDLYDRGGNIGLSNLLYMSFMSLLPYPQFRAHLARYQAMMRTRSRLSYDHFWMPLRALFDVSDGVLQDTLIWLLGAEMDLGFEHLAGLPDRALNVTPSSLLMLAKHWKEKLGRKMRFAHDESRDLARDKWIWDTILSPAIPPVTVGYDRRQISFPLDVEGVSFENSEAHPALQATDLIAGAAVVIARNRIDQQYRPGYAAALRDTGLDGFVAGGVWPDTAVTPEQLGTVGPNAGGDPALFIADLLPPDKLRARVGGPRRRQTAD